MWIEFNPSPTGRRVGDCSVRAIAKALDISWDKAYTMLCNNGFLMGNMPSANEVWGSVLREHGFYRKAIENNCPDCYTAEDFCLDHPKGIFVLGFGNHVATVVDGDIYDLWDSSDEIPQYVWYKPTENN